MSDTQQTSPLFDSSKKALSFALNHSKSQYSQPLMSKAANALNRSSVTSNRPHRPELSGLDVAGQAGLILLEFNKLTYSQIHALTSRVAAPTFPCSCGSPCCTGVRPNPDWVTSIKSLCELLRAVQAAPGEPGKKRTHTHPQLRRMLVEKHFGRKYRLSDLAEQFSLSDGTVTNHFKPIQLDLTELESSGWTALDVYLTDIGIVGSFE